MDTQNQTNKEELTPKQKNTKAGLYVIIGVLLLASFLFRIINEYHLETTSILFIGLPALMAFIIVKYTNTPKNAYGVVFRVITLFLLLSAVFLGEGIVCVIFMAPIFYGVGVLLAFIYQLIKSKGKFYSVIVIPILILLAQPLEINKVHPTNTVQTSVIIDKSISINAFNKTPNFLDNYPLFFKIGFPKPVAIEGNGVDIGDKRTIDFKSTTKGIGTLSLEIIENNENKIVFKPTSDNTHIDHWLTWERIEVEIHQMENNQSEIRWTTSYRCDLGPSWYFEPFEEFAVKTMNKHLINAYFAQ